LSTTCHYVSPFPLIIQVVDVVFTAVAIPWAARVLEPVVPAPAKYIVSVVIAIVIVAPTPEIKVRVVPTGNATDEFAGIVTVLVAEA
jgi:hypothetical protein